MMMNKNIKNIMCIVFSAIFSCQFLMVSFATEKTNYPEFKKFDFISEMSGGIINKKINYGKKTEVSNKRVFGTENLPSKYDLRNENVVTKVKNQGDGGICWAFSTISAAETNCIKKGITSLSNTDFSEDHLAWFTNNVDPKSGDGITYRGYDSIYEIGGTWQDAATTLINWWGVENEENAKYHPTDMSKNGNYSETKRTVSHAHLQNIELLGSDFVEINENRNEIKKAIMEKGSCTLYYYSDESNLRSYSYYQCDTKSSNHSVAVIGWDDNYSRLKFKSSTGARPKYNGAWLIKNNWGTNYANKGYMWISYFDTSLSSATVLDMESKDNYDYIYSYNGCSPAAVEYLDKTDNLKYANAFTAKSNEILKSVGLWTLQNDVSYTVNIYKNLRASNVYPESGTLVKSAKTTGSFENIGYHTIKLKDEVNLTKGERYSVVVTISQKDNTYVILPFEGGKYDVVQDEDKEISINYSSGKNESYIYYSSKWYDTKNFNSESLNNALICAYTVKNNSAPSKSHIHDNGVWIIQRNPTYFSNGVKALKCSGCGGVLKTQAINKLVLPTPENIKAIPASVSAIKLSYSKVKNAAGYHIFNRTTKKTYVTSAISYTISQLSAGTKYEIYVRAFIKGGGKTATGSWSKPTFVFTKPDATRLSAAAGKNCFVAAYRKVNGATGYQILYSTDSNFKNYKYFNSTNLSEKISNLISGKNYYVKVRAYIKVDKTVIWGQFSNIKSVKVR